MLNELYSWQNANHMRFLQCFASKRSTFQRIALLDLFQVLSPEKGEWYFGGWRWKRNRIKAASALSEHWSLWGHVSCYSGFEEPEFDANFHWISVYFTNFPRETYITDNVTKLYLQVYVYLLYPMSAVAFCASIYMTLAVTVERSEVHKNYSWWKTIILVNICSECLDREQLALFYLFNTSWMAHSGEVLFDENTSMVRNVYSEEDLLLIWMTLAVTVESLWKDLSKEISSILVFKKGLNIVWL